jgi:hypothetical protein
LTSVARLFSAHPYKKIHQVKTGYLSPPGNAEALTERRKRVIANTADRERVATDRRRFVEHERAWKVIARRYATIDDQILSGTSQIPNA